MQPNELRAWRKRTGFTQADAAEKFRVSRQTIISWEAGTSPLPELAETLCEIWENRLRQRDEHGPVTLVWSDIPMHQPAYGPIRIPQISRERHLNNSAALARADELEGDASVADMFIVDDEHHIVWTTIELAKRRTSRGAK